MIFIWGFRLFGRVDEVPGIFHVATKFFHIWYIPLIPVGSHLVLGRTSTGAFGKAVPFRFKSVILAWARALCVVAALFFGWQATLEVMNLNAPIGPYAPQGSQVPAPAQTSPAPVGVPTGPAASP